MHMQRMAIQVPSANCQGLGSIEKRRDLFNYLKEKSVISFVSKTHIQQKHLRFFRSQWNNECLLSSGTSNSRGVAILFSKNIDFKINNSISDQDGN